jgi:hypothetical protein
MKVLRHNTLPSHKHGGIPRSLSEHEELFGISAHQREVPVGCTQPMKPCFSGHLLDGTVAFVLAYFALLVLCMCYIFRASPRSRRDVDLKQHRLPEHSTLQVSSDSDSTWDPVNGIRLRTQSSKLCEEGISTPCGLQSRGTNSQVPGIPCILGPRMKVQAPLLGSHRRLESQQRRSAASRTLFVLDFSPDLAGAIGGF